MLVLALDCAVGTCIVGLVQSGAIMAKGTATMSPGAGARLPELTRGVLRGQRVPDLVAVTVGPGSFTGIRAGLAFAQGLASGWSRPLVGVTVIEALVQMLPPTDRPVWVALHSRSKHVFLGNLTGVASYALDAMPDLGRDPVLLGDAAMDVASHVGISATWNVRSDSAVPQLQEIASVALARWAGALSPLAVQPFYVDAPAVTQPAA